MILIAAIVRVRTARADANHTLQYRTYTKAAITGSDPLGTVNGLVNFGYINLIRDICLKLTISNFFVYTSYVIVTQFGQIVGRSLAFG